MLEIDADKIYKQLKKQNGDGVAHVIRDAALLNMSNIVHILEFAGNNPDNAQKLLPVIREIYKMQQGSKYNTGKYPLKLLNRADMLHDFWMVNGQIVQYNYNIGELFFGSDYYFSDSEITRLNKDYEVMLDYFILDKRSGTVRNVIENDNECTCDILNQVFQNKKILVKKYNKNIKLFSDDVHIATVSNGKIIELNLPGIDVVGDKFMYYNKSLKKLKLPDTRMVGNDFLIENEILTSIESPKILKIGNKFLYSNINLPKIFLPEVTIIADFFLTENEKLKKIYSPKLTIVGEYFLSTTQSLTSITLPEAIIIGPSFLWESGSVTSVKLPKATTIGHDFLSTNHIAKSVETPNATMIGDYFLYENDALQKLNLPEATIIGHHFLSYNTSLRKMNLPKVLPMNNPDIERLRYVITKNHKKHIR